MIKNITLGQYFPGDSPVHRMDARVKLLLALGLIVLLFVVQTVYGYLACFGLILLSVLASRISVKYVLKGIKPLWFILLLTFVLNIFFITEGRVLLEWWIFRITEVGLIRSVTIAVRLVLLITITTELTLTTSPMEITDALERLLTPLKIIRFPAHEMALMMSIALRFIPTLIDETDRIMKAQTARGASFDSGGLVSRAKGLVPILVPLFVSAFKRADELALAMESRCYNGGENRTRMKVMRVAGRDFLAAALVAAVLVFICFGF